METPKPVAPAVPPAAPAPRSATGWLALVLALIALALGGVALWLRLAHESARGEADAAFAGLRVEVEGLGRRLDQSNREREALRLRLEDAEGVNKSLREELLGVSERARVLEDAVANLAEKRLSGHDALLLDEAELVLLAARERYTLFRDAESALGAYAVADAALADVEDPAFATVRETLAVEQRALTAAARTPPAAGVAALEALRERLAEMSDRTPAGARADGEDPAAQSRLWQVLGRFVRISRDNATPEAYAPGLARLLIALDLRQAEAALLDRDPVVYSAALARARGAIEMRFDRGAAPTAAVLAEIDRLAAQLPAETDVPLGAALTELRNLRSTHRLRGTRPAPGGDKS